MKSRLEAGIKAANEGKVVAIDVLIAKAEAELEAQNATVHRKRIQAGE